LFFKCRTNYIITFGKAKGLRLGFRVEFWIGWLHFWGWASFSALAPCDYSSVLVDKCFYHRIEFIQCRQRLIWMPSSTDGRALVFQGRPEEGGLFWGLPAEVSLQSPKGGNETNVPLLRKRWNRCVSWAMICGVCQLKLCENHKIINTWLLFGERWLDESLATPLKCRHGWHRFNLLANSCENYSAAI